MITIGSLVQAISVLGLVMLWATNVTQIAIAWTIGTAAYTMLYCLFAFLAVREVGGHWEDLGGSAQVVINAARNAARRTRLTATSQQRALGMLERLAEEQRAVDVYWQSQLSTTTTQGLFSIAAFRAAERQRQELRRGTDLARGASAPIKDREHRQAFELLFKMAQLQRTEGDGEGNNHRRSPRDRSGPGE
jgi:hypothetical protein